MGDSLVPAPFALPEGLTKTARFRSRTTRILTSAGGLSTRPSFTTNWNDRSLIWFGAVKLGVGTAARVPTDGPSIWVQRKVRGSPSGSLLKLPSRVTSAPADARPSARISALGGELEGIGSVMLSVQAEAERTRRASVRSDGRPGMGRREPAPGVVERRRASMGQPMG